MPGTDDRDVVAEALNAAAETGRATTPRVDVAAAMAAGSRRRLRQRRARRGLSLLALTMLTLAIAIPVVLARSNKASSGSRAAASSTTFERGGPPPAPMCRSSWLRITVSPPYGPAGTTNQHPPTTTVRTVRVSVRNGRCLLPADFAHVRRLREPGYPYASVEQRNVGHPTRILLDPGRSAVARIRLQIPWFIPYSNLCQSWVVLGVSPPRSTRVTKTLVDSSCGNSWIGTLKVQVGPFRQAPA